jgi:hypothetical protein
MASTVVFTALFKRVPEYIKPNRLRLGHEMGEISMGVSFIKL